MTVGEARVRRARIIVISATVAGCAAILLMSRGFNFYFDEWDFILAAPDWTLLSYLQPHNEHPSLIPKLVYGILLNTAGLRTYVPYMVVLMLLHGANVVLVFELVRRRSGEVAGMGAAALLLFLGAGWENLLWAFQITFVGSVACGLGALLALELPRTRATLSIAVALTAASLMFSGIGIALAVAVGVHLAASPERRREVLWLVPLAAAVLIWYLVLGRSGTPSNPPPTASNILLTPGYAVWGIGAAAAGLVGEGGWAAPVALVLGGASIGWTWWRRRPDAFALGAAAALVTFYLITAVSRAGMSTRAPCSGSCCLVTPRGAFPGVARGARPWWPRSSSPASTAARSCSSSRRPSRRRCSEKARTCRRSTTPETPPAQAPLKESIRSSCRRSRARIFTTAP